VPLRHRFEALATLADALAARHRLDFPKAKDLLHQAIRLIRPIFEANPAASPLPLAENALQICQACAADIASPTLLRELLDNALRTAAQGRYEDAAARLYRAMEMQAQLWLSSATDGLFTNGRCKPENTAQLPDALKAFDFCRPDARGEIKLSLEQSFKALAALGHAQAHTIAADLALDRKSRFRAATEKRNTSILAHGVQPIGADGFAQMKQIATDFLGFDLTHEAHPILPLDPQWFEQP
jgi:CRISPR-associated protein (TIGR02710 family)